MYFRHFQQRLCIKSFSFDSNLRKKICYLFCNREEKEELEFRITDAAQARLCVIDHQSSWSAGVWQLWCLVLGTTQPELVGEETDHFFGCSKAKEETHTCMCAHTHCCKHNMNALSNITLYLYCSAQHLLYAIFFGVWIPNINFMPHNIASKVSHSGKQECAFQSKCTTFPWKPPEPASDGAEWHWFIQVS